PPRRRRSARRLSTRRRRRLPRPMPLFDLTAEEAAPLVPAPPDDPREGTLAVRAARFHARNPQVYGFAGRVARFMKARGLAHYGIGAVWEVMRFKYLESTGDIYKLNNSYRAWYARQIMRRELDLVGFFAIRQSPHDPDYFAHEVRV